MSNKFIMAMRLHSLHMRSILHAWRTLPAAVCVLSGCLRVHASKVDGEALFHLHSQTYGLHQSGWATRADQLCQYAGARILLAIFSNVRAHLSPPPACFQIAITHSTNLRLWQPIFSMPLDKNAIINRLMALQMRIPIYNMIIKL